MQTIEIPTPIDEKPRYRLLQPHYLDDIYFDPVNLDPPGFEGEIVFTGTPTEWMEPLNKAAEDKMLEFLGELTLRDPVTGRTPDVKDLTLESMRNRPRENLNLQMPSSRPGTEMAPLMSNTKISGPQIRTPEQRESSVQIPARRMGQSAPVRPAKAPNVQGTAIPDDDHALLP